MTQFIQSTPGTIAAAMGYQSQTPQSQYGIGQLALARGGPARRPYAGGSIGGGIIQGTPMAGGRTGYWKPWKKAKKFVKKLIPKEIAPAMMAAAPFMGPIAGPIMGGLGSYKTYGKIDPRVMLASTLPHVRFGGPTGMGYGDWGGGSSIRRLLTGKGRGTGEGILNKWGDFGTKLDASIFGSPDQWETQRGVHDQIIGSHRIPGQKGFLGLGGDTIESGDLGKILMDKITKTKGKTDLLGAAKKISAIMGASATYAEAVEMAQDAGLPPESLPVASEDEFSVWLRGQDDIDTRQQVRKGGRIGYDAGGNYEAKIKELMDMGMSRAMAESLVMSQGPTVYDVLDVDKKAQGGRAGYAMGSAQFPPQKRMGLQWGSDKGEGLGGMEVEADMRYDGGFMPYGEEPKADDVPARLSKDEFVFTDEAVAGAGDGDVNVGAERLYNVMKNLEQGGRLSEETEGQTAQGLGAMV
jgi:hypothetical protein